MSQKTEEQRGPLASLRRRWAGLLILSVLSLASASYLLQSLWQPSYALRWMILASSGSIYLLWLLWRGLKDNRRQAETALLGAFGAGNNLTIARGFVITFLAGFLFSPPPPSWLAWIPGVLYGAAITLDFLDGFFARITNHVTRFGEAFDMKLDGAGLLIAITLAVQYGQIPGWYLIVGFARYLYLAGKWLLYKLNKPVYELSDSSRRRAFAGVQMGFIFVMLLPVFSPPETHIAATLFAIPFLAGFLIDGFETSGGYFSHFVKSSSWIANHGTNISEIRRFTHTLQEAVLRWAPLPLRAVVVAILIILLSSDPGKYLVLGERSLFLGVLFTETGVILALTLGAILLLSLGAAGRVAALAVLISTGLRLRYAELGLVDQVLIICATALFFLGSGAYSIWKPEDGLIQRKAGEIQAGD